MLILTWVCIILSRSWPTGICETSCYTWFALKVQTITFKLHMSLTTNDFELFMHMWDVADALSLLEEKMFGDPKFSNWNVKGNKIVMVIHFSSLEIMLSFYCITQPLSTIYGNYYIVVALLLISNQHPWTYRKIEVKMKRQI